VGSSRDTRTNADARATPPMPYCSLVAAIESRYLTEERWRGRGRKLCAGSRCALAGAVELILVKPPRERRRIRIWVLTNVPA
jgi:hypothetical protein